MNDITACLSPDMNTCMRKCVQSKLSWCLSYRWAFYSRAKDLIFICLPHCRAWRPVCCWLCQSKSVCQLDAKRKVPCRHLRCHQWVSRWLNQPNEECSSAWSKHRPNNFDMVQGMLLRLPINSIWSKMLLQTETMGERCHAHPLEHACGRWSRWM